MNKQEVIRKAYGEYWERLTELQKTFALENNGRTCLGYSSEEKRLFNEIYKSGLFDTQPIRPKSLQGIENNNEWIMIESDEDLPKESGEYWVYETNGFVSIRFYTSFTKRFCENEMEIKYPQVSHWQPIVKPEKPIY